ncbi:MAG TPA: hypothetical protein VLM89_07815 [Phycisphaerae bacterium]|nr:hypothetical protein [Phycisphaerae bacterium]
MTQVQSKEQADAMAKALETCVNAVLLAKVYAQVQREKMDGLDRRLLAEIEVIDQWTGKRITDPKFAWCMTEEQTRPYYDRRNQELRAMGYDLPADYCPALLAEEVVRVAERNLVVAAEQFFPDLTVDALLSLGLDAYHRYIDLLMGLVVSGPDYRKPAIPGDPAGGGIFPLPVRDVSS